MTTPTHFWSLANTYIRLGKITRDEALQIVRPGTRKQNYWDRHIKDLEAYVASKETQKENDSE